MKTKTGAFSLMLARKQAESEQKAAELLRQAELQGGLTAAQAQAVALAS